MGIVLNRPLTGHMSDGYCRDRFRNSENRSFLVDKSVCRSSQFSRRQIGMQNSILHDQQGLYISFVWARTWSISWATHSICLHCWKSNGTYVHSCEFSVIASFSYWLLRRRTNFWRKQIWTKSQYVADDLFQICPACLFAAACVIQYRSLNEHCTDHDL